MQKHFVKLVTLLTCLTSFNSITFANTPKDGRTDIWPTIPFVRGADLCRYKDAYQQTRTEYMSNMVQSANSLLRSGASGREALMLLGTFNEMYDRNIAVATQYQYLDVTLESTFKAYLDQYYRDLKPRVKKLSFTNVNDILSVVRATNNGQREGYLDQELLNKLDYIAIGSYSYAPNCQGDILVTIQLIGRNGETESFVGNGKPQYVMSQIASKMFTHFQQTKFPSKIKVGSATLELIGGMNGSVDRAESPELAAEFCATLEGRLPSAKELEILNGYGDWSGGVSLNDKVWALPNGRVYAPYLKNPSPVREKFEVNADEYLYYCVK